MSTPQEDRQQEEENVRQFNADAMAKLDAIADVHPREFAERAEEIGALQKGTVARLEGTVGGTEAKYPNHADDFERRVREEVARGVPPLMALKIIFNGLYVPAEFVDGKPVPASHDLMSYMGRVVKPEDQEGMAEDAAVRAVAVRLDALTSKRAQADVKARIAKNEQDKGKAEEELGKLEKKYESSTEASRGLKTIDIGSQLTTLAEELETSTEPDGVKTRFKTEIGAIYGTVNSMRNSSALAGFYPAGALQFKSLCENHRALVLQVKGISNDGLSVRRIQDFINAHQQFVETLREFLNTQEAQRRTSVTPIESQIAQLDRERGEMSDFAGTELEKKIQGELEPLTNQKGQVENRISGLNKDTADLSTERDSVKSRLQSVRDEITNSESKRTNLSASLKLFDENLGEGEDLADYDRYERLIAGAQRVISGFKEKIFAVREKRDLIPLIQEFDEMRPNILAFAKTANLPAPLKEICSDYISAYDSFRKRLNKPEVEITKDLIDEFFSDHLERFGNSFAAGLAKFSPLKDFDRDDAKVKISEIDTALEKLKEEAEGLHTEISDLDEKLSNIESELDSSDSNLQTLDSQISALTPHQVILNKAVPKVDPAEKRRARREAQRAKQLVGQVDKAQDFLENPANQGRILPLYNSLMAEIHSASGVSKQANIDGEVIDFSTVLLKEKIHDLKGGSPQQKAVYKQLVGIRTSAKNLYNSMRDFVKYLPVLVEIGVASKPAGGTLKPEQVVQEYNAMKVFDATFKCEDLKNLSEEVLGYFKTIDFNTIGDNFGIGAPKLEVAAKEAKDRFDELEKADKEKHLTKYAALKQAVKTLLKEQNPELDDDELEHRATLVLVNDRMIVDTLDSYEKIAKNGSRELFEAANDIEVGEKILAMELKEPGNEKVERPFQGYKAENIANVGKLEELIESGNMPVEKGFIVLAAYEHTLADTTSDVRVRRLRNALKTALMKKEFPAAEDYSYLPKVNEFVDQAFELKLAEGKRKYDTWSEHYDSEKPKWDSGLVNRLNEDYKRLEAQYYDRDEISKQKLAQGRAKLLKEARDGGVHKQVSFAMDSAIAGHHSRWLQDFGHRSGVDAKETGKAVGMMGVDAAVGTAGQAAKRTFRFGKFLTAPLWWAVKYPTIGAAKISALPRHVFNFFTPERWHIKAPFQGVKEKFKADTGKAKETGKSILGGLLGEIKNGALGVIKGRWGQRKPEYKTRAERSDFDVDASKAKSEEYVEEAKRTPAELPATAPVDLSEIKAKIDKLVVTEVQAENAAGGKEATET